MRGLILSLLFLAAGSACAYPAPDYGQAARVSVRLVRKVDGGTLTCSGWVNAHHAVKTDEHCIAEGTDGFTANGRTMQVLKALKDGNDHVILLTDLYFEHVATLGPEPELGAETFTLGNPDGQPNILLTGRVAGHVDVYDLPGWGAFRDVLLIDSNDWRGCSGAAVFDRHGRVVGMVNAMFPYPNNGWRLTAAFGMKFTPEQEAEAEAFNGQDTQEMALARFAEDLARLFEQVLGEH